MEPLQKLQRLIPRDALLWLAQQPADMVFDMGENDACLLGRWLTAAAGQHTTLPTDTIYLGKDLGSPGAPAPQWMQHLLVDLLQGVRDVRPVNMIGATRNITAAQVLPILQQAAFNWIPEASMRDMAAFMGTMEPGTEITLGDVGSCLIARFSKWAMALPEDQSGPSCGFSNITWTPEAGKFLYHTQVLPEWMRDIQTPMHTTTVLGLRRRLGKLSRDPKFSSEYHKL